MTKKITRIKATFYKYIKVKRETEKHLMNYKDYNIITHTDLAGQDGIILTFLTMVCSTFQHNQQ